MRVGVNWWPFNHYGRVFGPQSTPAPPGGAPHWLTTLPANLRLFKQMGVTVVRWFVLGNGTNYGAAPVKIPDPALAGVPDFLLAPLPESAKTVYRFTPPPALDPQILAHFRLFLDMFKHPDVRGLQVIPSLIDFHFASRPDVDGGGGGRTDVIVDTAKRAQFLDTVLQPLLLASRGYEEQIYAWEVMNEPIHLELPLNPHVGRPIPLPTYPPGTFVIDVPEATLASFLRDAIARVDAAGFKSTVGHRFLADLARFPTGTRQQFHYYAITVPLLTSIIAIADLTPIPDYNTPLPYPALPATTNTAFVGEIGSRLPGEYSVDHGNLWPELSGRDGTPESILYERLNALKAKNYELALVWPETENAGLDTVESKLTRPKIKGLIRFTGGSYPGLSP
jgi:hypothetical protein